jgi:hypothetical protein
MPAIDTDNQSPKTSQEQGQQMPDTDTKDDPATTETSSPARDVIVRDDELEAYIFDQAAAAVRHCIELRRKSATETNQKDEG